jgi:tetratricopeptide (TPR) repeat protein
MRYYLTIFLFICWNVSFAYNPEQLTEKAEYGSKEEQYAIGLMFEKEKNYIEAIKWYKLAAEKGDLYAQNNLGAIYKNGLGVTQNYNEGIKWLRMAAEHGSVDDQYNLGEMYEEAKDYTNARMMFEKALQSSIKINLNPSIITEIENKIANVKNREYIIKKHGKKSNEIQILHENMNTDNSIYSVINNLDEVKIKCNELGFKPNSEKFGKCVLELMK